MLSARGAKWAKIKFAHGKRDIYHHIKNPRGIVSFANAENYLVHEDVAHFVNTHSNFDRDCCSYGEGFTGSVRLRTAMANHLNMHFEPAQEIDPEEITFAAGVTDLNEVCALLTCDPGQNEAIMLGGPIYGSFSKDLTQRTGVELEYISMGDMDQFSPACIAAFDAGFEAAKARGVNVRALIICNPHNPLGQCYPRETLEGLLRLCAAKGIHLISDEIYALSTYARHDRPSEKFTSVRAIDPVGIIDPAQVHVLYGMSKDFGASGMRLGCVISQNQDFTNATRATCRFSSPSQFSMELAAQLLEDQEFLAQFLQKSDRLLLQNRLLAEDILERAGIEFHKPGNAGFFIWLDLSAHLPTAETNGDAWAAERLLTERFEEAGVIMSSGEPYHAPSPGRFRLIFSVDEETLREGLRRIRLVLG
ncbi:pyridoxal phosphate-dependent transferase [Biscogniauxia mediterranea]|nr:pyridoxal phosphate-dependent transferase [Biscogniauxia mediterranea]